MPTAFIAFVAFGCDSLLTTYIQWVICLEIVLWTLGGAVHTICKHFFLALLLGHVLLAVHWSGRPWTDQACIGCALELGVSVWVLTEPIVAFGFCFL